MYHAAANNDIAVVKILMKAGAEVRPNMSCKDPLAFARTAGLAKMEALLGRAHAKVSALRKGS